VFFNHICLFFKLSATLISCHSMPHPQQIPLEGFGTPYTATAAANGAFIPEVYIDGNEVPGRARLRVGTAALHDGR
jgi:hypothetical protein